MISNRTVRIIFCAAAAAVAIAGRALSEEPAPKAPAADAAESAYRISSGDVLEVKFFYNSELNETIQVRPDGRISLNLVGEIPVENRTVREATAEVQERYSAILTRPSVNIIVRSFAAQKIYVGGEVNRPGEIPLLGHISAEAAVLEAGGSKHTGTLSRAILIRKDDAGHPIVRTIDISIKRTKGVPVMGESIMLKPFDVVLIPETKIARVDRWVDEYLRQSVPMTLTGGFSYLFNPVQTVGQVF